MTDHNKLRTLAENATPGPWFIDWAEDIEHDEGYGLPAAITHPVDVARQVYIVDDENGQALNAANAEFIAAANPAAVLALLDELTTVTAERDAYRRGQGPAPTPATGFQQGVNYNDPTGWYPIPNSRGDDQ